MKKIPIGIQIAGFAFFIPIPLYWVNMFSEWSREKERILDSYPSVFHFFMLFSIGGILVTAFCLFLGMSLLKGKNFIRIGILWFLWTVVLFCGYCAISLGYTTQNKEILLLIFIGMLSAVTFYLTRARVKEFFKKD